MENPTQALILAFAVSFWACSPDHDRSRVESKTDSKSADTPPSQRVSTTEAEPKIYLGNSLYSDDSAKIYLKAKNRVMRHPSQDRRSWKDSVFLSEVHFFGEVDPRPLSAVVNQATFRRVNATGNYFMDTAYIYVHASTSQPVQFFALSRQGGKFLGERKEYLLHRGTLYSEGRKVEGLDNRSLSMLRFPHVTGTDFDEFITDGKRIFIGKYPLDSTRLSFVEGISAKDRRRLDMLSRNQPPPLKSMP